MTILHIDFETRSACDLSAEGLDNYAKHPTTSVLCLAYAFDDEPVDLIFASDPDAMYHLHNHVRDGGLMYCHNAAFEFSIWNHVLAARFGWPELKTEQMRCTMAMAYAMGLPGSLDNASAALGLTQAKDAKGGRVMKQISKPKGIAEDGSPIWWDDADKLQILYDYCKQDVEVERALHHRLMELSPSEQDVWRLDQKINARGIKVDVPSIDKAMALVSQEKHRLDDAMRMVTGNAVAGCTDLAQLKKWIKVQGVEIGGLAKADINGLLATDLPAQVRHVLLLRQEAGKTSTAKLPAMKSRAGIDGRMRGLFQYHGAATGRWAGRGPQPHNFERATILKKPAEIEDVLCHLEDPAYLDMMYGSPTHLVADCMRSMITAEPGNELIACDYANIEGRVLAWLAGEDWKVQAFRDYDAGHGADLYILTVMRSRGVSEAIAKAFRQEGKVEELAFQYGGGKGAMATWCRTFGLQMEDSVKEERKVRWRAAHPKIVAFWSAIERAAIRAVQEGGKHTVRGISFKVAGSFLWCQLPSDRVICYPYPQIGEGKFGGPSLTYMSVDSLSNKWVRVDTYGGALTNNVTQAIARDILVDGMMKLDAMGYDIVMHVHDEIVVEAPIGTLSVDKMATVLSITPQWAAGLPLAASGYSALRYRKD